MITVKNYFDKIKRVDITQLRGDLREGHHYMKSILKGGRTLKPYEKDIKVKSRIDNYLQKLNLYLERTPKSEGKPTGQLVEYLPEEFRLFRRALRLNGKSVKPLQVLNLILSIQRAVTEKRIPENSPWKKEIRYMERALIKFYNEMHGIKRFTVHETTVNRLKNIIGERIIYPVVKFIKRFIALQGKTGIKARAAELLKAIENAKEKKRITSADKYFSKLNKIQDKLSEFVRGNERILLSPPGQLSGLQAILVNPEAPEDQNEQIPQLVDKPLSGLSYGGRSPQIMNSMDFMNLRFPKLGFKDEWREFIGDPSAGFYMVVYAPPKMGKSLLCIMFAGYLARNHGKVLYVAREEGLDSTLQEKMRETEQQHPNFFISSFLIDDLAAYDFIFLDSINKLGLEPENIDLLRRNYPGKSFISVFQVTKEGKLRGSNEHAHDADIIVNFVEPGKAVQYGRFNQGGEMTLTQIKDK